MGKWGKDLVPWGFSLAAPRVARQRELVRTAILVRVRGLGATLFPGAFVPLGLRAASPGLYPDAVAPDRAQEVA